MTLDELKRQRLERQRRDGLTRWRELVQRMGVTALVLQHPDFLWNWKQYPEARRREFDLGHPPWLDLNIGVPIYSAWYLPPTDPCWEGHTRVQTNDPEFSTIQQHYPYLLAAALQMPCTANDTPDST